MENHQTLIRKKNRYHEELFIKMPVIDIIRNIPLETMKEIVPLFIKAGLTTIEVTMNSTKASETISYISKNHPNLNVGAGTVCDMNDLQKAFDAGATFIVTPIVHQEVIVACSQRDIPIFSGAYTPTEIYMASKLGASMVKVFPATQIGPAYIKDVLAPLNNLKLVPTGGVSIDNIASFFKAGAAAVGMGSSLFDKKLIAKKDFEGLLNHFKKICAIVSKNN
jgi:2-dehydro-3-deoxyphosphogluconate aldolase/(4S)-4-hydroxy-2-oxoglutarate aldolase